MERPVQVGDFALVGGELFKITAITPGHIEINSLINPNHREEVIYIDNRWKIKNTDVEPKFLAEVYLTFVPEIDINILAHLGKEILDILCSSNDYMASLCQNESLWRAAVKEQYPDLLQGKEPDETWRDFYYIIPKLFNRIGRLDLVKLLEYGRLNLLKQKDLTKVEKYYLESYGANKAAEYGHTEILDWLFSKGIYPDHEGAQLAAENGHTETVIWIHEKGKVRPTQIELTNALFGGYFDIVKYLWSIDPTLYYNPNIAAAEGRLDILDWMENEIRLPYKVDSSGADMAAAKGRTDVLDLLAKRGIYPTILGIYEAAENGHFNVLKWARPPVPPPDQELANMVLRSGKDSIGILDWLKNRGALPDYKGMNAAIEHAKTLEIAYKILEWGARQNPPIFPDQYGADRAAWRGWTDLLELIYQKTRILPSVTGANLAAGSPNAVETLNWIEKKTNFEVYPDEEGAIYAAENGRTDALEWITEGKDRIAPTEERLVTLDEEVADAAAINGQVDTLDWLAERDTYSSEEVLDGVIKRNHLNVLKWLKNHGYDITPAYSTVEWAFSNGYLDLLEWLDTEVGITD